MVVTTHLPQVEVDDVVKSVPESACWFEQYSSSPWAWSTLILRVGLLVEKANVKPPTLADDGAAEPMLVVALPRWHWSWRDATVEYCWWWCCRGDFSAARCRCRVEGPEKVTRGGEWEPIKIPHRNLVYIPKSTRSPSLLTRPRPPRYRQVISPLNQARNSSGNMKWCLARPRRDWRQKSTRKIVYILTGISPNTLGAHSRNHRGRAIWTMNPRVFWSSDSRVIPGPPCNDSHSRKIVYILTAISPNTLWARSRNHCGRAIWTTNPWVFWSGDLRVILGPPCNDSHRKSQAQEKMNGALATLERTSRKRPLKIQTWCALREKAEENRSTLLWRTSECLV
jgi:hypothetical protein